MPILNKLLEKCMQATIKNFENDNGKMKNICQSGIVCLTYINMDQSAYSNIRKAKIFKKEFKNQVKLIYESLKGTDLEPIFDLAFENEDEEEDSNVETMFENIYNNQKVLKLDNDLEVEKFIDSRRRMKRWKAFMERIGSNLVSIGERFNDPELWTNQVLLTDEYDDQTSDEEIAGFDFEVRKQAELDQKKDIMVKLIGNQLF